MQKPLLLKKYCMPGVNMLQLNVKACCCSHLFELNLVHRPSITSVKSRIFKERLVDREHSLNKSKNTCTMLHTLYSVLRCSNRVHVSETTRRRPTHHFCLYLSQMSDNSESYRDTYPGCYV